MTPLAGPRPLVQGSQSQRTVLGLSLIAIGAFAVVGLIVPDMARFTMLGVSSVLFVAFALTRDYGFGTSAGITGGLGLMIALVSTGVATTAGVPVMVFLSLAAGFVSVWLLGLLALPREPHPWPLVPASIFATFAVGLAIGQTVFFDLVNVLFVGVVLTLGSAMTLRHRQA